MKKLLYFAATLALLTSCSNMATIEEAPCKRKAKVHIVPSAEQMAQLDSANKVFCPVYHIRWVDSMYKVGDLILLDTLFQIDALK